MKYLVAAAAVAVLASAQTDPCQRGWFRYASDADSTGYDGAVDFKACTGKKFSSSAGEEYGRWYACSTDAENITDTTMYVYERYYDSFKCNDGNKINETMVGAIGDLNDAAWVATMQDTYPWMFMLFEEDDTYCTAAGTVQCTIETDTIVELSTSGDGSFVCNGTEQFREKKQFSTRMCADGQVFNCTAASAFKWTIYENSYYCTGSSNTYTMTSGCMNRIEGVTTTNQTIVYDMDAMDEMDIVRCESQTPTASPTTSPTTSTTASPSGSPTTSPTVGPDEDGAAPMMSLVAALAAVAVAVITM